MFVESLSELLKYQNENIIRRYEKDYPNNKLKGKESFEELMKFFWLNQKHKDIKFLNPEKEELDFVCSIHPEMSEIDDMWHTFLLFTKDYMFFCEKYFNEYIHHVPNTLENELIDEQFEFDFTRYLLFIYDNLGEKTVVKWFDSSV